VKPVGAFSLNDEAFALPVSPLMLFSSNVTDPDPPAGSGEGVEDMVCWNTLSAAAGNANPASVIAIKNQNTLRTLFIAFSPVRDVDGSRRPTSCDGHVPAAVWTMRTCTLLRHVVKSPDADRRSSVLCCRCQWHFREAAREIATIGEQSSLRSGDEEKALQL
jgi:hypothetical protein